MSGSYDDLIDRPHHTSRKRSRMSKENRAAQFSPFAALTGYEDAIEEAARLTDNRIVLSESDMAVLDMKMGILNERIAENPEVAVTYFRADERKEGGAYITAAGTLKKIDEYTRTILLTDSTAVPIEDVLDIESVLFKDLQY